MDANSVSKVFKTLNSYHWDAEEKANSDRTWTVVSCPLAPWTHSGSGRDMHPSFSVNIEPGDSMCKCYSCDFTGTLEMLVREVFKRGGIDENERDELLTYVRVEAKRTYTVHELTYTPLLPSFLTDFFYEKHEYMAERGLDDTDIMEWSLGYSEDLERMLIPFYDDDQKLLAVIGRDVTGEEDLKYMIYPKGFPRSRYLFGENKLTGDEEAILVVEGYLDAVVARKYLPKNIGVVAIGTAIPSQKQLRRLVALAPEIVIGLDNPEKDKAGEKGYQACKDYLLGRCKVSMLDYRQFKDAGEAGEWISTIVEHRTQNVLLQPLQDTLSAIYERLTSTST